MSNSKVTDYNFKLGIHLPELQLPFEESLAAAKEIGAEYVWFGKLPQGSGLPEIIPDLTIPQAEELSQRIENTGLKISLIGPGSPFKQIDLTELEYEDIKGHPVFRKELEDLVRTMEIASVLGIGAVNAHAFTWPGEYLGKPTWAMRWLTQGGVISENLEMLNQKGLPSEMDKLAKALSLVLEEAEKYDVDLVLSTLPWHYTNTTTNFRQIAERVGSKKLKAIWGPADSINSGELNVSTVGFKNIQPYLHSLHLKDLHVIDGLHLNFKYTPIGEGDTDYLTILRNMRRHKTDAVLAVASHFTAPSGLGVDAVRINFNNIKSLIEKVENEPTG